MDKCQVINRHNRQGQEGTVLLVIMLMIIMFTGMGLLAMRQTQAEMKSAGVYLDSTQAAVAAEAAIAMTATDIRLNCEYRRSDDKSYCSEFERLRAINSPDLKHKLNFSPYFDNAEAFAPGDMPDVNFNGLDSSTPLAQSATLGSAYSDVTVQFEGLPEKASPPSGFSNSDQSSSSTYNWCYYDVTSSASFGAASGGTRYARGQARARARMKIGPIRCK